MNEDEPNTEGTDSTDRLIPIKDAYYQLIGNNVLSIPHMRTAEASVTEQDIAGKLASYRDRSIEEIRRELMDPEPRTISELPEDQKAFMYYIYTYLSSDKVNVILRDQIDTTADYYTRWRADSIRHDPRKHCRRKEPVSRAF